MEIFGKTAVFPGGYGRIGEIQHGRIWPDWGNTARADMAGLGSIGLNTIKQPNIVLYRCPVFAQRD